MFRYDEHYVIADEQNGNIKIHDYPGNSEFFFPCQKVFSQFTPWIDVAILVNSSDQYTVKQKRSCIRSNIGEPRDCVGPPERLETFFWVRDLVTYDEAKQNCTNKGAKLFDELDGTTPILEFLVKGMLPTEKFWVGLKDDIVEGVWITEEGQRMNDYFSFAPSEPKPDPPREDCLILYYVYQPGVPQSLNVMHDAPCNYLVGFVCHRID